MLTRSVIVGLITTVTLLASGCSAEQPTELPTKLPSSAVPAAPILEPGAAAKEEAVSAYRGMWDSFVEAAKTSDPEAPELREYATGDALKLITGALLTNREEDRVILGELKIDPKVKAMTPADAPKEINILDCVNDEKWLLHKKSGGLVDDVPGSASRTTAKVIRTDDGWRVSGFTIEDASC
ncbi:hypothetical protein FB565_002977 [Actinoplanes lutulentus]|uniref:Secreted protein/lipoprotein n=1 Tax=Actinoplanes lutulentus TaxID=1287878 RepID=A0A327Z1L6_9ACTN|nr:hypothetical protein [Actinoplanes lutulentus]MBB2943264.1 hypothetical protein [Actinoplanes lutulentus]RAK28325.1 hypothetical protein B0I29_12093 [Actinoplanes lutulentus]